MRTFLVAFGSSLVSGLLVTRVVRDLARRFDLVDEPVGGRKIHRRPVPRLGGMAVAFSASLPVAGLFLYHNKVSRLLAEDTPLLWSLVAGSAIMLGVGAWDDIKGSRAGLKLLAQVAAALAVYQTGIRIEAISVPFLSPVQLGLLSMPATVFWMVLVMNAVNLIDGMDGLAGGVVILAGGTLFVMSVIEGNTLAALLLASVVGATLGFLVYNLNPASIFLGDTGSLWLGFMLALVSVHSSQKSYTLFSIVAALLALGLPIFDLSMAVVRRYLSGQPIFRADQHHIHHILLRKGLSQSQSVVLLFGAAVVLEGLALVFIYADDRVSAVAIAALLPLVVISVKVLGYGDVIRNARRERILDGVQEDAARHADAVEAARAAMEAARSEDDLWSALCSAASELGLERVEVERAQGGEAPVIRTWARLATAGAPEVHHEALLERTFAIAAGERAGSVRYTSWGDRELLRPLGWAFLQVLTDGFARGLGRLDAGPTPSPEPREGAGDRPSLHG